MSSLVEDIKKEISKQEKELTKYRHDKEMYSELINQLNNKIMKGSEKLGCLKQKLDTFENNKFISDHALLRYLERSKILNIEEMKSALLTPEVINALFIGAEKVHINGYEFRIKNGRIITIIKEDGTDD